MRFHKLLLSLLPLLLVMSASGATIYQAQVTNTTGGNVYDIHLVFVFTGGGLSNGVPVTPANWTASASSNMVDGDWNNTAPIANNGIWRARFTSQLGGIAPNGGNWTDINGANIGAIPAAAVTLTVVPEPSSALLLTGGAALLFLRRRTRQ